MSAVLRKFTKFIRSVRKGLKTIESKNSDVRAAPQRVSKLLMRYRYGIALSAIMLLGLFLSLNFFYGPTPINGADNDFYSLNAYWLSTGNWSIFTHPNVLDVQYLLIMAIAIFYFIFSPSRLSSVAFGIICFLLTIVAVYLMGSKLRSKKAGLLSALVYSFNPLAVIAASYVGNDSPMMAFISFAVLFLVLAFKNKTHHRLYYSVSGFLSLIAVLVSGRAIEIMPFMAIVLFIYLIKTRSLEAVKDIAFFAGGTVAALFAIVILSMAFGNSPFYVFTVNLGLTWNFCPYNQFGFYSQSLFPYRITTNLASGNFGSVLAGIALSPFTLSGNMFSGGGGVQSPGIYGYLAIAAAVFLLFRKQFSSMYLPILWFIIALGWISFGVYKINPLLFLCVQGTRFMIIFMPALALLIGIAIVSLVETPKKRLFRCCAVIVALAIMLTLFYNSYLVIRYVELSQYRWLYSMFQVVSFLKTLPSNSLIIAHGVPLDIAYTGARLDIATAYATTLSCEDIQNAAYLVDYRNSSVASLCNLTVVFTQPQIPSNLDNYTLFVNNTFGVVYLNETVYRVRH